MEKILIIRFSSLGDLVHCMPAVNNLRQTFPQAEIHWLVRSDLASFVSLHPGIDKVWSLDRKSGLKGLFKMLMELRKENFSRIYDAHNNVRSHIASFILRWSRWHVPFLRRSKDRLKRFFLFKLNKNYFPKPFQSGISFLRPLGPWNVSPQLAPQIPFQFPSTSAVLVKHQEFIRDAIALAPSAAWDMKRWPIERWLELVEEMNEEKFVVLGGPEDEFCQVLQEKAPTRVLNLAGRLSWNESAQVVSWSKCVVSGDTGLMHIADFLGRPTVAIVGPTAFGYPSRSTSTVVEKDLNCKPCSKDGRGRCRNDLYKKCLVDIKSRQVVTAVQEVIVRGGQRA